MAAVIFAVRRLVFGNFSRKTLCGFAWVLFSFFYRFAKVGSIGLEACPPVSAWHA
ncbi:MAG: hypothetical protein ONB48_07355 [candidate division KSB1 bacterium]|nr:hypothetical protein [candidate division KSB1 bacterium]MDZ7274637.1 hypothetical protein [candidate division KSB1 bacterium]MDZ7285462.1 hypothetical protein [candidate division KSB1 bacterium]MDZ7298494.1 hypothetical protein [candidate division KSB1 bacterium]MDZ7306282.1 hypothetical protein [candidate division KSB1 bacterium]